MTARLALLYSATALATIISLALGLFLGLQNNISHDEADAIARQIDAVDDLLGNPEANAALLKLLIDPPKGHDASENTYIRVLDGDGRMLFETTGMTQRLPSAAFATVPSDDRAKRYASPDGHSYLVASSLADSRPSMIPAPLTIDAAINLKKDDKLVADYRDDMIVALMFGTVLSALGGYLVARRGLRPLRDIAHAIQRIRAEQLHDRLHAGRWPTELTLVASEFDRMLARLEDSFQRLRQLSADLAHELRTPVHAMLGQTEVTLSRPRTAEEYRQVLESNLEEQERLARLIDNLLFLARADNAQTALVPTKVDVGKELYAVTVYFDAMAQDRSVTLSCSGDANLVADRSLFQRAVNNLVSNAIRHSPPGGKVRLSAHTNSAGNVEIRVADSGCGIMPDEMPRVFERFYRGNNARSSQEGAGLGLAIVRSIMTLHGGSVDLANAAEGGVVATLSFNR